MIFLAELVAMVPPWLWLTLGLGLLVLDIISINSDFLGCIGLGFLGMGLCGLVGLSGQTQLIALPSVTVICAVRYRHWLRKLSKHVPHRRDVAPILGAAGVVLDVNPASVHEGRAVIRRQGEWRVRSVDGSELTPRASVTVVGRGGLVLLVQQRSAPDPDSESGDLDP